MLKQASRAYCHLGRKSSNKNSKLCCRDEPGTVHQAEITGGRHHRFCNHGSARDGKVTMDKIHFAFLGRLGRPAAVSL